MSYGKEFQIDNKTYFIEKNDTYIYVAKKNEHDSYNSIFEGDYTSFLWDKELIQLRELEYDKSLYIILYKCLQWYSIIDNKIITIKKVYCDCCNSAWIELLDENAYYVCSMCRDNNPERFSANTENCNVPFDVGND